MRERQISLTELPRELESTFQVVDTSAENSEIFIALGMELLVTNLTLAEAIHQLNEIKRKIVLLYYFGGFNDREIEQVIGMSGGGVWYQRKKAQSELRDILEEKYYV
ncbi:RNA polymerase sigma factor [Enterococcus hirae]|uniref:RNA polymerase sigma factor n=1 Tax=Enterococcus hirae TaxID=1354 RepID=UPI0039A6F183